MPLSARLGGALGSDNGWGAVSCLQMNQQASLLFFPPPGPRERERETASACVSSCWFPASASSDGGGGGGGGGPSLDCLRRLRRDENNLSFLNCPFDFGLSRSRRDFLCLDSAPPGYFGLVVPLPPSLGPLSPKTIFGLSIL